MLVYTDSIDLAERMIGSLSTPWSASPAFATTEIRRLGEQLYGARSIHRSELETDLLWRHLFIVESAPRSQYDVLIEIGRGLKALPDGTLCLAGSGQRFHGFKDRPWTACAGNIHLSVYLAPARPLARFDVGFTPLAAVSVVDALDSLPGLEEKAGIKWVNDILVDDAKVCGVLAHTQSVQETLSAAVVGIGLNVETRPSVEPTRYVPKVASLRDFARHPEAVSQAEVFPRLIRALDRNYRLLLGGHYGVLLDRYRQRSVVIGRTVRLCSDDARGDQETIASGRVTALGESLELFIEGYDRPFKRGRLILVSDPSLESRRGLDHD